MYLAEVHVNFNCIYVGMCINIFTPKIWGIGNDADNYMDGSNNLSAILNLIHPQKKRIKKKTLFLQRAARPNCVWGRRALVREVTKNAVVTVTELLCGDVRTFQKDNHLCSTPTIRPLW